MGGLEFLRQAEICQVAGYGDMIGCLRLHIVDERVEDRAEVAHRPVAPPIDISKDAFIDEVPASWFWQRGQVDVGNMSESEHGHGISSVSRRRTLSLTGAINKCFQAYWRMTRGTTLGAQAAIFDGEARILLVRHGYRPGWHFPGGGVEWNETLRQALEREIFEEVGVVASTEPELHGVFANFAAFPGDHVTLYVVRDWHQPVKPEPNKEIAEWGFFAVDALPDGVVNAVAQRLGEIVDGQPLKDLW